MHFLLFLLLSTVGCGKVAVDMAGSENPATVLSSVALSSEDLSDDYCYALQVTGAHPELNRSSKPLRKACEGHSRGLGKVFGLFAKGQAIQVDVPRGPDRHFELLAVAKSELPAGCDSNLMVSVYLKKGLSEEGVAAAVDRKQIDLEKLKIYLVGTAKADLDDNARVEFTPVNGDPFAAPKCVDDLDDASNGSVVTVPDPDAPDAAVDETPATTSVTSSATTTVSTSAAATTPVTTASTPVSVMTEVCTALQDGLALRPTCTVSSYFAENKYGGCNELKKAANNKGAIYGGYDVFADTLDKKFAAQYPTFYLNLGKACAAARKLEVVSGTVEATQLASALNGVTAAIQQLTTLAADANGNVDYAHAYYASYIPVALQNDLYQCGKKEDCKVTCTAVSTALRQAANGTEADLRRFGQNAAKAQADLLRLKKALQAITVTPAPATVVTPPPPAAPPSTSPVAPPVAPHPPMAPVAPPRPGSTPGTYTIQPITVPANPPVVNTNGGTWQNGVLVIQGK